jgi:hypothetical protein
MSPTNPLLKDGPMPQPSPHEPSMEEILASIRRIIADDQALLASESGLRGEAPRPDPNGEASEPGSRAGAGRSFVSTATDGSVRSAPPSTVLEPTRRETPSICHRQQHLAIAYAGTGFRLALSRSRDSKKDGPGTVITISSRLLL